MAGSKPTLTPLQARKQLLVSEADLQRGQIRVDLTILRTSLHDALHQVRAVGTAASIGMIFVGGLSMLRRNKTTPGKSSRFSRLLSAAKWATSAWYMLRSRSP